jgi:DNA-binding transcriptional regulator YiaG
MPGCRCPRTPTGSTASIRTVVVVDDLVHELPAVDPEALQAIRKSAGLSREQLAVAAGISMRTVERTERGDSRPRPVVVAALALALGVEAEALSSVPAAGVAA